MKILLLLLFAAGAAFSAGWDAVHRIAPGTKIEVQTRRPETIQGTFVSASDVSLVIRSSTGERSIERANIRRVLVMDRSRRARKGVLAAVGGGVGLGIGFAICPHCANEGAGGKFTGPMTAVGAGVGALGGLLSRPYRTIYKSE